MEAVEVGIETTMSDIFKEAESAARKASSPSEASCAEELLANGWTHLHASIFWRSPSGELFPSAFYAWQSMKQGLGIIKHCTQCGQQLPE